MAIGPSPSSATRARNAGSSLGGAARRRQAVGLSLKTWRRVEPELIGAVDRPDHPLAQGEMGADPSSVGKHARILAAARGAR